MQKDTDYIFVDEAVVLALKVAEDEGLFNDALATAKDTHMLLRREHAERSLGVLILSMLLLIKAFVDLHQRRKRH